MNPKTSSIKEIAENYANKVWNDRDITIVDKVFHKDVVIHSRLGDFHGPQAMKDVVHAWLRGFPDLRVENDSITAENDLVTIHWRASGTHKGEFKGRQPTGKTISYSGVTLYRIKEGKIVEYWAYLDMQQLINQI